MALGTVCLIGGSAFGQTVNSDSWAATDALGRKVSEYKDAGDKKKDKFIAMFYWTWHQGNDDTTYQVKNISEIVRKYPEAMKDYNHPAWGDKGDVYYLQLVDNVRKFKGMYRQEKASAPKTIRIGRADGWDGVAPYFASYKGNTMHRRHKGYGGNVYENNSGRNDIVGAKVARDADNVYFYVETADKLTPATDRNWMMLLIDVDRDKATGWNGYDLIVNRTSPHGKKAVIEKNVGGRWEWEAVGESKFAVNGNKLELAIAKQLMNLTGDDVDIEFKWNDNMQENGNIMDFYVNGDTAPGGRFNYVYTTK